MERQAVLIAGVAGHVYALTTVMVARRVTISFIVVKVAGTTGVRGGSASKWRLSIRGEVEV